MMSLKNLIKTANYYNVKYGFSKIASSNDKLDYAIKMLDFHNVELTPLQDSIDPISLEFAEIHKEAIKRYENLIKKLSNINFDENKEMTEEEKFISEFRGIFNSWSKESNWELTDNLQALSRKLSKKDPKDLTIDLSLQKNDDKFLEKLRFLKALSDRYIWLNFNIISDTLTRADAANEFSSSIKLNGK